MPCYHPIQGWRAKSSNPSGKRSIVFDRSKGYSDLEVNVPCGMCIGCRLERSRQWAVRCVHEASMHDDNCFVTLTYEDTKIPGDGSLNKKHLQDFWKRLRKFIEPDTLRYYACGEYGEETIRPHYHACIFGFDFPDKKQWKQQNGNWLYTSEILNEIWSYGYCIIGDVTFDSAAYVARYIMKKVLGDHAPYHYGDLTPEFNTMSRRPGIGGNWLETYKDDIRKGFITINGKKIGLPKYYDSMLDRDDPDLLKSLKARRTFEISKIDEEEFTLRRLDDKLTCKEAQINLLPRRFDNGN
jgi:hypothetical protein